ncbi:MAG TPA: glycoside hydrolase family 3 C-terminal domain-containing protein [Acidimicrobiales bacterium]|nr:glycoside hydrolase family 3 C-terminal domain-containing protein [Acidimicrobiales bacterium]
MSAVGRAARPLLGAVVVAASLTLATPASSARPLAPPTRPIPARCPWVAQARRGVAPARLAHEVAARLTLAQMVALVSLHNGDGIENMTTPIAGLCLPALTLSDGPVGVAGRVTGVTQFPSALDLAASFDPALAHAVGAALGAEARAKGIDVVQAPELNLDRVPLSGRLYETLGEDPFLTTTMGLALARGIVTSGDLVMLKHLGGYTQETARARIDQVISRRALVELYDAPFRAIVRGAPVAAVMCATGLVNGVRPCNNPYFYGALARWGFTGLVRADLRATKNTALAFERGLDMVKGLRGPSLTWLVEHHRLPRRDLLRAASRVLSVLFTHGLVAHPRHIDATAPALTPAHAALALAEAEGGIVLLKDRGAVLPLTHPRSVAVIGAFAKSPLTTGQGSAHVLAPFVVTPLQGLTQALGPRSRVTYVAGAPTTYALKALRTLASFPTTTLPAVSLADHGAHLNVRRPANVTNAVITADTPGTGPGWSSYTTTLRVAHAGLYVLSLRTVGDAWLRLNGRLAIASRGLHASRVETTTLRLTPRRTYTVNLRWFSVVRQGAPALGLTDASPAIARAVRAARHAAVAVVVVGAPAGEGADLANLSLPGDQNALVSAVARANPHTVVVLDTANPVAMPWLGSVAGVLEAWYGGEEMGRAIAAVLTGAIDPSGRLPVTFPRSLAQSPLASPASFPGVDDVVNYGTGAAGLEMGYRWFEAHHVRPLFPFGFGLSYTHFDLAGAHATVSGGRVRVSVTVTNTGARAGADVLEVYVSDPSATGETFGQLRAVARVALAPSARTVATVTFPVRSLAIYTGARLHVVAGTYAVDVATAAGDVVARRAIAIP